MIMDRKYYALIDKQVCGPFGYEELMEKIETGEWDNDVLVAPAGGVRWLPARLCTREMLCASVGPCPSCGKELFLSDGEVPPACPSCGTPLRMPDYRLWSCVRMAFTKWCDFKGRATRSEYWWFSFFSFIVNTPISLLFVPYVMGNKEMDAVGYGLLGLMTLVLVIWLLPALSVMIRRLHDVGRPGVWGYLLMAFNMAYQIAFYYKYLWQGEGEMILSPESLWVAIFLMPYYGLNIYVMVCMFFDSQRGTNKYGPSVKYPLGE